MNAFGIDVSGLDVDAFMLWARALFPLLAAGWLWFTYARGRAGWLLLGVVLGNAWVWGVTNFPLRQLYALSSSTDRLLQLGMVQVVAAGNSPVQTSQVGHLHFEPFWGLFVSALSGWSTDRVMAIYPFLSLAMAIGFALSLHFGLTPPAGAPPLSPWARALAAGAGTLLSSAPLEYLGTYRVPWALTFLLKPNHALGLVLVPWVIWALSRVRTWRHRIATGLLLHLLGWVFVLHMGYVAIALVTFALLSWLERRTGARTDALDVATVLGVNLAIVSPYLVALLVGYPFLVPSAGMGIPAWSPHVLEGTLRHAPLFVLGLWGAWSMRDRGDRFGRLFFSVVVSAILVWCSYPILGAFGLAREKDEIYYWIRFLTATAAGFGAWDLVSRGASRIRGVRLGDAARAVLLAAVALPSSLPYWWDPRTMDSYFEGSLEPIAPEIADTAEVVRRESRPSDVFAGEAVLLRWVAALTGRRGLALGMHLPSDRARRYEFTDDLVRSDDSARVLEEASRWGVRYALLSRRLLDRHPGTTLESIGARRHMTLLYEHDTPRDFFALFRLEDGER